MKVLQRHLLAAAFLAAALCPIGHAADPGGRWAAEFNAFAQADQKLTPERGGVVFVGSSSIRLWDGLEKAFDRFPIVVKRGFGGSTMSDCVDNLDRLVIAYQPRWVVVYAGENDISEGASPADVAARVRAFTERVRQALPEAHISYVSIKPSPSRLSLLPAIQEANDRVRAYFASIPNAQYIDVHTAMLDGAGQPRAELFGADRLHMNADGYALWRRKISAHLP